MGNETAISFELPERLGAAFAALDPAAGLSARLDAVEDLARWVVESGPLRKPEPLQLARLGQLVMICRARPELAERLAATLQAIFRDTTGVALFAEAGIPGDRGLVRESIDRIAGRILPRAPDDEDLEQFVSRVFRRSRDCAWLANVPLEMLGQLGELLGDIWRPIRASMADAVALLCTRISALGLSPSLRPLGDAMQVRDSPFFRLPFVPLEQLPTLMFECQGQLGVIHRQLEATGVSVDVVYRVDTIRRMLRRVEKLVPLLEPGTPGARTASHLEDVRTLVAGLTAGRIADQSVRQLARQNLGLLARKVIERVGHTGEHYVTSTRREYLRMLVSAAGGGALTALTVIGKFLSKFAHFAPFVDSMLAAANYSASFLAMQFLGLTLATKQPSMTAAALAATIRETKGQHQLDGLVTLIARISRSQLAAAIGNVFTVIPVVILLDFLWVTTTGNHFLDAKVAATTIASFDPLHSGTIFYAAVTGVLLWLSSLGAGWLENWVTYRRLPDAIRAHRMGRIVGTARMNRIADFVTHHSAGIGGSVALGFLLAFTPFIGTIFGIPLDVRHITLSTGSLTFAGCTLGMHAVTISACIGIAIIGLLNFGVSFVFALAVAFRARDVTSSERNGLLVAVLRRFLRHPLEFLVPPRAGRAETQPLVPVAAASRAADEVVEPAAE